MAAVLGETLLDCREGLCIETVDGRQELSTTITLEGDEGSPIIRAEGLMLGVGFTFRSGPEGSSFSVSNDGRDAVDAEDAFHQFAMLLHFHRKSRRLEPLDYDRFYDIHREDVPVVRGDNYSLLPGEDLKDFLDLLGGRTGGICMRNVAGKYSIIRYSENARITESLCRENIPVYRSFLEDFRRFYGFTDGVFVFCRRGKEQHVFFYSKRPGPLPQYPGREP